MLSMEQRQDVLDLLRADHADGSAFSLDEVADAASSPLVTADGEPSPSENEVRMMVKCWEWRTIVAPASDGTLRFRGPEGVA